MYEILIENNQTGLLLLALYLSLTVTLVLPVRTVVRGKTVGIDKVFEKTVT